MQGVLKKVMELSILNLQKYFSHLSGKTRVLVSKYLHHRDFIENLLKFTTSWEKTKIYKSYIIKVNWFLMVGQ